MATTGWVEYGGELGGLVGSEGHGAADDYQLAFAGVQAGDHDLRAVDRPEDSSDDDFSGLAVLHLSSGSLEVQRTVARSRLIGMCATPVWS